MEGLGRRLAGRKPNGSDLETRVGILAPDKPLGLDSSVSDAVTVGGDADADLIDVGFEPSQAVSHLPGEIPRRVVGDAVGANDLKLDRLTNQKIAVGATV